MPRAQLAPSLDGLVHRRFGAGDGLHAAPLGIGAKPGFGVTARHDNGSGALPVHLLAPHRLHYRILAHDLPEGPERAAARHGLELARVADENELGPSLLGRDRDGRHVAHRHHPGFVDDE